MSYISAVMEACEFSKPVDLDAAIVKVAAAYSKHRRDDVVPLRSDLAQAVAVFLADRPADAPLFTMPDKSALMLRTDLQEAGYFIGTNRAVWWIFTP